MNKILQLLRSFHLNKAEILSAREGLLFMQHSVDPMHDLKHIENMLKVFTQLLEQKKLILSQHEQKIAVLSIVWHDVWKSQRVRIWALPFWYDQLVEGLGSMWMFQRSHFFQQLSATIRDEICYVIRKHSNYQVFGRHTTVSQIVYDLDMLERFSWSRMHIASQALKKLNSSFILENSWLHVVFEEYYMDWLSTTRSFLYHDWAKERMIPLKNEYFTYLETLRIQLKKESYFNWSLLSRSK